MMEKKLNFMFHQPTLPIRHKNQLLFFRTLQYYVQYVKYGFFFRIWGLNSELNTQKNSPEKRIQFDWPIEHRVVPNRIDEWYHIYQYRVNTPIWWYH